jgi:hypothetical protein
MKTALRCDNSSDTDGYMLAEYVIAFRSMIPEFYKARAVFREGFTGSSPPKFWGKFLAHENLQYF